MRAGRPTAAGLAAALLGLACQGAPGRLATIDAGGIRARIEAAHGRPLLVSFWATWCKPCVEELPDLAILQRESPGGLQVLAVSLDGFLAGDADSPAVVERFLREHPSPLEQAIYAGSQDALFDAFDLPGSIPYAILYAAGGMELARFDGRADPAAIRAALGGEQTREAAHGAASR